MLHLRGTALGAGAPKVCVPVVATTPEAAADAARDLPAGVADVVELRLDHLEGAAADPAVVAAAVRAVRDVLPDEVPLLATFRSVREGGAQPADEDAYAAAVRASLVPGVDAVDVELAARDLTALVADARAAGAAVVVSHHDVAATPPAEVIVDVLRRQREAGADVCKVAVMPQDADDVLTLLVATRRFTAAADRPVVTVAMGGLGLVSRLAGELVGSAMTFGTVGAGSAPGQVEAERVREVLTLLHGAL